MIDVPHDGDLFSVDQVANQLGLHVRTVRNYVREGRLKAVRIGKQYRIARADFEALTGRSAASLSHVRMSRPHAEVSAVVHLDGFDFDASNRLTNALMATAKSRPDTDDPLRVDTIHDNERGRLKVIINGSVGTTATLMRFIDAYLEPR